ncbi:glycosyltransferase [Geopsychrobacter electrodiphilus]|uniref:glycosyltransferase n=1 Tax=Geopsychrobacter electrodiphilus TaxID=225196 RepID=UPI00037B5B9B|nr:glycosyltransferase [Geopsychrobacter electrodiphilus]
MKVSSQQRHILIAWELGGGLGHITRIASIAKGFIARGDRVSLCLQDLSRAYEFVAHLPVGLYQAPVWLPRLRTEREPVCFSDILLHKGYGNARGLLTLTLAWQTLFKTLQPDLLLLDYAPTAFLAARDGTIPKVIISSGFGESTAGLPDRCLRPWNEDGQKQTQSSEKLVVGIVNQVLKKCRVSPIRQVSDLFQADHIFLFMVPEIDMQKNWRSATYLRPPQETGSMEPAIWPTEAGKRVFAYLKPSARLCLATIASIAALDCVGLIVCAGLPEKAREEFQRPGLKICVEPCDLSEALEVADVVVCHAGKNTLSDALFAGKPVLLLPEQLEQFHNALQVEKLGAGLYVREGASQQQIQDDLSTLLEDSRFSAVGESLAKKNAALKRIEPVTAVVDHCERLIASTLRA